MQLWKPRQLRIGGLPVGQELAANPPIASLGRPYHEDTGSIIIVVATDAPLLPHQTKRLARRATMGLARTGATSGNGSGDIFIAFSTGNPQAAAATQTANVAMVPNDRFEPFIRSCGASHGRSHRQRHDRRRNYDRSRRPHCYRPTPRWPS